MKLIQNAEHGARHHGKQLMHSGYYIFKAVNNISELFQNQVFYMILHVVKKKIIHSTNTEKCRGCYCAPPRFLLLDEEIIPPGAARSLAAKGSQLIPLWEFCSELPQLRLRPLLVKQENQSQRSHFNLDQL